MLLTCDKWLMQSKWWSAKNCTVSNVAVNNLAVIVNAVVLEGEVWNSQHPLPKQPIIIISFYFFLVFDGLPNTSSHLHPSQMM